MSPKNKKEEAILFFLKKYGILLEFEDDSFLKYKKRVAIEEEDTFKKWKEKVLGNPDAMITVFGGFKPSNNTRFSNIKRNYAARNLSKVLGKYKSHLKSETKDKIRKEIDKIRNQDKLELDRKTRQLARLPKEILQGCVESHKEIEGLEPSVAEFFYNWLDTNEDSIELEKILSKLIKAYNSSVTEFRALKEKLEGA